MAMAQYQYAYLHYEGGASHAFSVKHRLALSTTADLDETVGAFATAYNSHASHSQKLDPQLLELCHEDGRPVSFLQGHDDAIHHQDDIFLVACPRRAPSKKAALAPSAPSSSSGAQKTPPINTSTSTSSSVSDGIDTCIKKLRKLISSKSFAEARRVGEAAMKVHKKEPLIPHMMVELAIATSKFEAAVEYGEQACEGLQRSSGSTALSSLSSKKAAYVLALAYFHSGQFNDAWQKLRELTTSSEAPGRVAGSEAQNLDLDIIALQAECLFAAGRHTEAAGHINNHMNDPGAEEHMTILLAYSSFALQYGKMSEALRAMLKAVTIDQKSKRARKTLAEIVQTDAGFEELTQQLPPAEKSAAAYAFLATICKDFSAIPACIALFTISLRHRPDSAGYALNLMHAIELQCDFNAAIASVKSFLSNNAFLRAGKGGLSCGELLAALEGTAARVEDAEVVGYAVQWVDDKDRGYATTHSITQGKDGTFSLQNDDTPWLLSKSSSADKELFGDDDLDILAIGFTLIKLLYLDGRLSALPALYRVIEPTRYRSRKSLHETSIRNEHAYYQCIAQVLAFRLACSTLGGNSGDTGAGPQELLNPLTACCDPRNSPFFADAAANPIYAVGDSHCLSSAWSVVRVAGIHRLIVPKLVTGVKHWHLRPESDFYPKFNFRHAIGTIPEKSDVIVIIGEIDCREGILLAVERDKYASVQEGMKETLQIFTKVLSGLATTKKLRLFVHPVLPMLKETRPLVFAYNSFYRDAIRKLALKTTPPCAWLDFFDELFVDGQEESLRPGLAMDGTHISPVYCSLLEAHLSAALSPLKK